jgi:hypothetical protein
VGKHLIPDALCFWEQITKRPWIFESAEMLVPHWKVGCFPLFEGSCWQVRIAECVASFSDDGRWLPGRPELNFNVGLERNKMPAITGYY